MSAEGCRIGKCNAALESRTRGPRRFPSQARRGAFSLLELLVVIAIIGILAAISFPAMKNIGRTSDMNAGVRQILDDLALARQKAINQQTIVSMVFTPPDMSGVAYDPSYAPNAAMVTNLLDAPFRAYALYAHRSVGDQPGRAGPSYESEWQRLPEGVVFQLEQFRNSPPPADPPFRTAIFFFPTVEGFTNVLPYIAFDEQGSLVHRINDRWEKTYEPEFLDLARGSVLAPRDPQGNLIEFDVREVNQGPREERFARIRIDAFSGRARHIQDRELDPTVP